MALSATLSELETWIRQDADMQAPDDRVTSEECRNRINRSLAQLYDRLVLVDQEYFLRNATVASNGSGKYDILNDMKTGVVRGLVYASGVGLVPGGTYEIVPVVGGYTTVATIKIDALDGFGNVTAWSLVSCGSGYYGGPSGVDPNSFAVTLKVGAFVFGTGAVQLDSDFYKCKGVWASDAAGEPDNGLWNPLRRFNWEQQNSLNQAAIYTALSALPLYRIITENNRDKLLISPDQGSAAFKLWYYPAPPRMLVASDRFDGRAGWEDWIVKDVAIQLLMAEESIEQAAALKTVRDEIWQRIQLHAEDREAASPQKIMDVTLMSRRYGPRWAR